MVGKDNQIVTLKKIFSDSGVPLFEIVAGIQGTRRDYDDMDFVVRESPTKMNIAKIANSVVRYFRNYPERYSEADDGVSFGFPLMGGYVVYVTTTGNNVTSDKDYEELCFAIVTVIVDCIEAYIKTSCFLREKREAVFQKAKKVKVILATSPREALVADLCKFYHDDDAYAIGE